MAPSKVNQPAHAPPTFADMTIDGPEIGTLVAVIDRAKNLPNRKTMGKQDPYCAMRLGKDAKKTEADRRGGQTPRWDQELRFTVHDSPDYYKLKCSVFNDDKKTELIGETCIDLKEVIVPGGGQNDLWHQLQHKGKYAGDIRVELTYYDTRPQDGSIRRARRKKERINSAPESSTSSVTGPRQLEPKEVKRRPLPANPGMPLSNNRPSMPEQIHTSPLPSEPYPPAELEFRDDIWTPDHGYHATSKSRTPSHSQYSYDDQIDNYEPFHTHMTVPSDAGYHAPSNYGPVEDQVGARRSLYEDQAGARQSQHDDQIAAGQSQYDEQAEASQGHYDERGYGHQIHSIRSTDYHSPVTSYTPVASSPPAWSSPNSVRASPPSANAAPSAFNRHSTSPNKYDSYRDSPLRQSMNHRDFSDPKIAHDNLVDEDEPPPPPPPVHRSTFSTQSRSRQVSESAETLQHIRPLHPANLPQPGSLPLETRSRQASESLGTPPRPPPKRFSIDTRSPLQEIEQNFDPRYNSSPTNNLTTLQKYHSHENANVSEYRLPVRAATADEGFHQNFNSGNIYNTPTSSQPSERASKFPANTREWRRQSTYETGLQNHTASNADIYDEQNTYQSNPPLFRPRPVSPAAKVTPPRKSVNAHTMGIEVQGRLKNIPFGPDSYDVLNPVLATSDTRAHPNPELGQSKQDLEAAQQNEADKLLDQGPIIGNDGRVIDPSDHLPADTWAPEPERIARKPEHVVHIRTKTDAVRTPNRLGSSPASARPHSIASTPQYTNSPASIQSQISLGGSNTRNRLQKPMAHRPLPAQPFQHAHSSPAVPTTANPVPRAPYHTPSPRGGSMPMPPFRRPALSEYPMMVNGGGGNFELPPPIPDKIPYYNSTNDYERNGGNSKYMDRLSMELSTIDIGPSPRAARRAAGRRRSSSGRGC